MITKILPAKWLNTLSKKVYLNNYGKILFCVSSLLFLGLIFVYSASVFYSNRYFDNPYRFFLLQLLFATIGFCVMLIVSKIDYKYWQKFTPYLLIITIALLVLVLIPAIGTKVYGARRWIRISGLGIQPVELLKLVLILWTASFLANKKEEHLKNFSKSLLPIAIVFVFFAFFLLLQPDFGSIVLLFSCLLLMCFVAGIRFIYLLGISLTSFVVGVILILTNSYRVKRILAFLSPWEHRLESGYQLVNSLIAYGGGGLLGRGLGNSIQKEYFLPQAHTEFIFAVIAEETGIWGVLIISALFLTLLTTGLAVATQAKDPFGRNFAFGITILIMLQTVFNLFVVLGLAPTKGIGLPFISYGGSSLVLFLALAGILLNIAKKKPLKEIFGYII